MSYAATIDQGTEIYHLPSPFSLESGQALEDGILGFERFGENKTHTVLVLGGISADRHVCSSQETPLPGWWDGVVGPGLGINTKRFRVLGLDYLSGTGASTGPANSGLWEKFPTLHTQDHARAIASLLRHLQIESLDAIVGASFGGMVGLAFAELFPERLKHLVCISAAHEPHPLATAWRSIQRRILQYGYCLGLEKEAVQLARALAMTTYRSSEEFSQRFESRLQGNRFPVEEYLEARGKDFSQKMDSYSYLRLSASIELHRVKPENISTRTTLIASDSDMLVPLTQMRTLAQRLPGLVGLHELRSVYGHDAFLKEKETLNSILKKSLEGDPI